MNYLPEDTEQKQILLELSNVIKEVAPKPFLNWPVWEPTRKHIPHDFPQNGEGVWQICRILLDHIGLAPKNGTAVYCTDINKGEK